MQVGSDIVFGRTVAMARSENDHQNEKEDSSRYQELQHVAIDILCCGTSRRDSKLTSWYLYVLPVRSETGSRKRERQQQEGEK
jgi:hypothetical protein